MASEVFTHTTPNRPMRKNRMIRIALHILFCAYQGIASILILIIFSIPAAGMFWVSGLFLHATSLFEITLLQGLFAAVYAGGGIVLLLGACYIIHVIISQPLPHRLRFSRM
jgi:hypothetical protein